MKYLNGQLRNEHDTTLLMRTGSHKQHLSVAEYVPIVVLCLVLVGVLMNGLLG